MSGGVIPESRAEESVNPEFEVTELGRPKESYEFSLIVIVNIPDPGSILTPFNPRSHMMSLS